LATVAAVAGTSVPTVSKVLRGRTDVSDETRDRVMRAIHDVGYGLQRPDRSNGTARSVIPPAMIDLVVSNVEGTWANRALAGVERAATAAETDVVITIARSDGGWVSRLLRRPSGGAIIVLVDPTAAQLRTLTAANIPVVMIDPMSRPPDDVASVGVTNWEGGRTAAEHLLERGHRHFGVVGGIRKNLYSRARIDGFLSALADYDLTVPTSRITYGDWQREAAAHAALPLLRSPHPPTAIFACSDQMALGVIDTARDLGMTIPEDLSVVGFDDVPEAEWSTPGLTTVRQPIAEMGEAAFRILLRMRTSMEAGHAMTIHREQLSTHLVVRNSTASLRTAEG
jgi:DNA-binding LacI/PurR family transcriptional regulator